MAKGSNPVDAHRKAQRKQELKKNKQKRETTREISTVKTDTRPIESEIRRLTQESQKGPLSKTDRDELARLRADLARLNKAKQEYVDKHPEHRRFVFPERAASPSSSTAPSDEPAGLYDRNGRLKHPERSLYFDPVFNPYGAPPPGMPYREKPEYAAMRFAGPPVPVPSRAEIEAFVPVGEDSSDDDGDDDDDIAMPAGPPPTGAPQADAAASDSDDSDDSMDIPLPPGPPPPRPGTEPAKTTSRPTISRPSASSFFPPPQHPPHALPSRPAFAAAPPPPHPHPRGAPPPPPAHGPAHAQPRLPARPPPAAAHMSDPLGAPGAAPQRAFQQGRAPSSIGPVQPGPSSSSAASSSSSSGAPPPAAPAASASSPFLALPGAAAAAGGAAASGATISAAPVLRDLKKEATAFVPAAMRRRMAQQKATLARAGLTSVDAARGAGAEGEGEGEAGGAGEKKKSLVEEMRERGIGVGAGAGAAETTRSRPDRGKEDYERFRAEMGDLL